MTVVYHYPRCSTCKKALQWLDEQQIDADTRDIVQDTPTADELTAAIQRSDLPIRRFFNTSGRVYREGNYKDKVGQMSAEQAARALAANGMLIKRPLVIHPQFILVGFRPDAWHQAFDV